MLEASDDTIRLLAGDSRDGSRCAREVPLAGLLTWLSSRAVEASGFQTPLLAPGTRFFQTRGDHTVAVVEQPPQIRSVQWVNEAQDGFEPRRLAFPFLVFVFSFEGGELDAYQQLYYRTAPLDGLDAPLLHANLLNVTCGSDSPAHWLCLGHEPVAELAWPAKLAAALDNFWTAGFNYDLEVPRGSGFTRLRHLDPRVSSVESWEAASRENPSFPLSIDWPEAGLTLRQAVDESMCWTRAPVFPSSFQELADALYRVPVN